MELRDLRYFLACVDTGSFTRAARLTHAAQPTLSHALARLEAELGVRLLDRRPRAPVEPTEAGVLAARRAREALAALAALGDDLRDREGRLGGTLKVAAIRSLSATLLPPLLARFARQHPAVQLAVRTHSAEAIPRLVAAGRVDLGLLAGAPLASLRGLSATTLFEEPLVALVRRGDPLARRGSVRLRALSERELVIVPDGTFLSAIIHDACREAGFQPRVVLTLASAEALRETVRAGLGLTILPRGYATPAVPGLAAVALTHPTPKRDVLLVEPGSDARVPPRAAGALVRMLRELVPRRGPRGASPSARASSSRRIDPSPRAVPPRRPSSSRTRPGP
jgi:DNA-binding transcriptional LysR family regulator